MGSWKRARTFEKSVSESDDEPELSILFAYVYSGQEWPADCYFEIEELHLPRSVGPEGGLMNAEENGRRESIVAKVETESSTVSSGHGSTEAPNDCLMPRTALHEVLVTVWSRILNVEKIGIQDDFFEFGGDSISATQLISRLRQMFHVDLPAIVLFEAPTVEKLAHYMIEHEGRPGLTEKTARLLKRIDAMSEEEVARTLSSKKGPVP
ncbi:MAG: phosphopantetheine-binding protein [Candidatus Sulfotelmatobacter sp.]